MSSMPRQPHSDHAPTRASQLRRGLGDPHLLITAVAFVLVVAGLLGLNWLVVSGRATALPESVLLRDPRDDWLHVSYEVGRLKVTPPDRPAVYVLGGSATRESFVGERSLARAVGDAGGGDVVVHELASNNQEFGSDLAIIDNLPQTPAVVVIGVGMERFVHGPDATTRQLSGRPLLVWSPALKDALIDETGRGRHTFTVLPGIADFAVTWAHWRLHRLRLGLPARVRFKQHLYDRSMAYNDAHKRQQVTRWLEHRGSPGGQFFHVFPYNAALLERAVALATARGFSVMLVENPLNTEIVGDSFDGMKARYQPLCEDLADRYGAAYVDFLPQAELRSSDFRDLTHMLYPGEVKYERALADALAPLTAPLAAAPAR
jgi:hypothetical protein